MTTHEKALKPEEIIDGLNSWAAEDTGSYEAGVRLVCASAASLIQSQAARIAELEAVVEDLATDLEAELNARYGMDPVHPAEARRKERDMEPVQRARSLLNGGSREEPQPTKRPERRTDWHYDSDGYCDNPGRGY